jgi:hypothetical protein
MVDPETIKKVQNFSNEEKTAKLYVFEKLVQHLQNQHLEAKTNPKYRSGDRGNKRDARRELFRLQVALRYIDTHYNKAKNFLQKKE